MTCKISRQQLSTPLKYLSTNYAKITAKKDITNLLAETFSKNLSSQNNQQFIKIKQNAEKVPLQFKSNNPEAYNKLFTLLKLIDYKKEIPQYNPQSK